MSIIYYIAVSLTAAGELKNAHVKKQILARFYIFFRATLCSGEE
ncbi:hypothetical protein T4E_7204 [Trichinella pseudospiralis]|uniref:Uncharacterized protein n=1 Tax=Trichinella pseudospiralis TaxID=6337 RepID=A0A0V0XHB0_TRIPS|nr:hypothetical protein T4E_7204 [Trichinella pseudospiralis]